MNCLTHQFPICILTRISRSRRAGEGIESFQKSNTTYLDFLVAFDLFFPSKYLSTFEFSHNKRIYFFCGIHSIHTNIFMILIVSQDTFLFMKFVYFTTIEYVDMHIFNYVSKFWKQFLKFSFEKINERKYFCISALASKKEVK